jgi:hypothetical protein
MTKTVLAPGAPWPKLEENLVVKKKRIKKKTTRNVVRRVSVSNLDYFAETHNELLQPQKRGRGNPNSAKNFNKFNLQFL